MDTSLMVKKNLNPRILKSDYFPYCLTFAINNLFEGLQFMLRRFLFWGFFLWLHFGSVDVLQAQKAVLSNARLNILYNGLENRLEIALDGVARKNIEVVCKHFKLIDSAGSYFVSIDKNSNIKETVFYVRDKSKRNNMWADSVAFRIKKIPMPIAQIGTLASGLAYQNGEISMQNTVYAYIESFVVDGVKYQILSYQLRAFSKDNLELLNQKVQGNKTQEIREFLSRNKGFVRIELDEIKSVLVGGGFLNQDTLTLKPLLYYTKVNANENLYNEENNDFKSSPFGVDSRLIVYNNIGNYKVLKQIVKGDTLFLLKRRDSANVVLSFERYHIDKLNRLKMKVDRISDTSYALRYFNSKGICVAEGKAYNYQMDVYNAIAYEQGSVLNSLLVFMRTQDLRPFGVWKYYHDDGRLKAEGAYKSLPIKKPSNEIEWTICAELADQFQCIGEWKIYGQGAIAVEVFNFPNP